MITQIKLHDSVMNTRALEEATREKEAWDNGLPGLARVDPSDRLEALRKSQVLIAKAEMSLNILIGDGYQIIAQYPIQSGVQLILYKPDTAPQPDEWPACNQCGGWHDPAQICGGYTPRMDKSSADFLARFLLRRQA